MAFTASTRSAAPTKEMFSPRQLEGSKNMDGRVIKSNEIGSVERFATTSRSFYTNESTGMDYTLRTSVSSLPSPLKAYSTNSPNVTANKIQMKDKDNRLNLIRGTADYGFGKGEEQYTGGRQYNQAKHYLGGVYQPPSFTHRHYIDREGSGYTPSKYHQQIKQRVWEQDHITGEIRRSPQRKPRDLGIGDIKDYKLHTVRSDNTSSNNNNSTTNRYVPTPPWVKKKKKLEQSNRRYQEMITTGSPRSRRHLITCIKTTDVADKELRKRPYKNVPPFEPEQWPFDFMPPPQNNNVQSIDTTTRNMNTASRPPTRPPVFEVVHDGTLPRNPSEQFLNNVFGHTLLRSAEEHLIDQVGKFQYIKHDDERRKMQLWEKNRVIIQHFLINEGGRRHIKEVDFETYKGKHIGDMVNMISEREDFEEYMNWLVHHVSHVASKQKVDTIDLDGDGNLDSEEVYASSRIGYFNEIQDPEEKRRLQLYEGRYLMVLYFVNSFRRSMWRFDPRYRTMSQKEILEDMINSNNYNAIMNDFRKKARALQTTSSDQVQTTMGGSKDYMPVKKEVTSRTEEAMNKACMDWAYDRIVDHESAFLKKHQGYSNMSGWAHQLKQQTMAFEALDKMIEKKKKFG